MSEQFARILSVLLHPVFMPFYGLYIIFNSDSYLNNNIPPEAKRFLYFFVFALAVAMPVLSSYILVRNKMISSMHMPHRSDRYGPYMITIFYYFLLYYLLRRIPHIPPSLLSVLLGSIFTLITLVIANNWIKLSAHAAGISGLVGMYFGLSTIWVIMPDMLVITGLILTTGFLASARLRLSTHTPTEVYLGAVAGFLSVYLIVSNQLYF